MESSKTKSAKKKKASQPVADDMGDVRSDVRYWMFQAKSEVFDLKEKLEPGNKVEWRIKRYYNDIKPGDIALFWMAGKERGLYGWGEVIERPHQHKDLTGKFSQKMAVTYLAPAIYKVRFSKAILATQLKKDSILQNLMILRQAQGASFSVSLEHVKAINSMIEQSEEKIPVPKDRGEDSRFQIKMKALTDAPIEAAEHDLLQHKIYSDFLVDLIRSESTDAPLTLGIDAPWGQGKSSLMNMMEQELKKFGLITVKFNAWRYDRAESLWAALAQTVLNTIRGRMGFFEKIKFNLRLLWERIDREKVGKSLATMILLFALSGALFLIASAVGPDLPGDEQMQASAVGTDLPGDGLIQRFLPSVVQGSGFLGIVLGFIAFPFTLWKQIRSTINPFNLKLSRFVIDPKYADRSPFMDLFHNDFKKIVSTAKRTHEKKWKKIRDKPLLHEIGDPGRLIIFIDDLDRCAPPRSVDIIEAINVILECDDCVFVLGMDTEMIRASIEVKYGKVLTYLKKQSGGVDPRMGQRFMEKIVQINFRIPPPNPEIVGGYFISLTPEEKDPAKKDQEPLPKETKKEIKEVVTKLADAAEGEMTDTGGIRAAVRKAAEGMERSNADVIQQAVRQIVAKRYTAESPAVRKAIGLVGEAMENPNPRKIKRFVNIFRLRAGIAEGLEAINNVVDLNLLAQWVFLEMDWPELVREVGRIPDLLAKLIHKAHEEDEETFEDLGPTTARKAANWMKDRSLMEFLRTWNPGLTSEDVEALRWL